MTTKITKGSHHVSLCAFGRLAVRESLRKSISFTHDKIANMAPDPAHLARLLKQAEIVLPRLEKLTPDLKAAHRASGVRRTLLRFTKEYAPESLDEGAVRMLEVTLERGFRMLADAAIERIA